MAYRPPHSRDNDDNNKGGNSGGNSRFARDNNDDNRDSYNDNRGRDSNRDRNSYNSGGRDSYNRGGRDSYNRQDNRNDNDNSYKKREPRSTGTNFSSGDVRSRRFGRRSNDGIPELSTEVNLDLERELFGDKSNQVTQGINFDEYDKIPVDVSGVECPAPIDSFAELLDMEQLLENIGKMGFQKPTPIQKYSIPTVISDRDLMACAQTGSGKTGAFLIPMIETLCIHKLETGQETRYSREIRPLCLILAPTRELAQQIHVQAKRLLYRTGMRSCCVYGGIPLNQQQNDLRKGVDILVATPGRLWDFCTRNCGFSLGAIRFVCLDEADRMLDMGFEPQIRQIISEYDMPASRRTLMFSATFPEVIQELAQDFLDNYIFLAVGRVGSTTSLITQQLLNVQDGDKMDKLLDILPNCEGNILVFAGTKRKCDGIEDELKYQGYQAITIHGNKNQEQREFALEQFRSGTCNVLVATDVAARGLDIPNVLFVIQYDLPQHSDDYVHRIGRTGRRGNSGTAISFCNEGNRSIFPGLKLLLQESKQEIPTWFLQMVQRASSYNSNRRQNRQNNGGRQQKGGRTKAGFMDIRSQQSKPSGNQSKNSNGKKKKKVPRRNKNKNQDDGW